MTWESVIFSVVTSVLASVLVLRWMLWLRPKIDISNFIAVRQVDGKRKYVIKVINRGERGSVNIKAELSRVSIRIVPGGEILSTKNLELEKESIFTLSKFEKNSDEVNYAYRFVTVVDVESEWNDDSKEFLRFKLYAHDEVSNFGKLFIKEFRTKRNSLKDGEFHSGNSFEVA